MALPSGTDDAGEDLLGLRAAPRAITATDFAVNHGGADGVLGPPVGRVDVGRPEEAERGCEFAVEMGGEALGGRQGRRALDEAAEASEQAPTGDGEAMLGDRLRISPGAERQGVGEDGLHARGPGAPRMVGARACVCGASSAPDNFGAARR